MALAEPVKLTVPWPLANFRSPVLPPTVAERLPTFVVPTGNTELVAKIAAAPGLADTLISASTWLSRNFLSFLNVKSVLGSKAGPAMVESPRLTEFLQK